MNENIIEQMFQQYRGLYGTEAAEKATEEYQQSCDDEVIGLVNREEQGSAPKMAVMQAKPAVRAYRKKKCRVFECFLGIGMVGTLVCAFTGDLLPAVVCFILALAGWAGAVCDE